MPDMNHIAKMLENSKPIVDAAEQAKTDIAAMIAQTEKDDELLAMQGLYWLWVNFGTQIEVRHRGTTEVVARVNLTESDVKGAERQAIALCRTHNERILKEGRNEKA